ncbi:helix-turn-helix transcriptional regulator [Blastococcus sp. TF02A-26]|uniref:helix-turn-helix domain-containing protein n=1 Tax=Blastococcus sp. TF02A-26 TaxID=2250577 RepID=UPI0011BF703A|nr:helix-turn-helix transcriptional regulator [Blastococcus sp. TF02A-26]
MSEQLSRAIAMQVRRLMDERQVSAYALSKQTGIPQSSLSRKLNGPAAFDFDDVQVIAAALGMDVTSLVAAAEHGTPPPTG